MRQRTTARANDGPWAAGFIALAVLIIGLSVTTGVVILTERAGRRDAEARFEDSATQSAAIVEEQVRVYFRRLRNIGAFLVSGRPATQAELERFVAQDQTFNDLPSLQAVLFVVRVTEAGLADFVAAAQVAHPGFAPLSLVPHIPGEAYYLLTNFEPGTTAIPIPAGADLGVLPSTRAIIEQSAVTGDGVIGSFQKDPVVIAQAQTQGSVIIEQLSDVDFVIGIPLFDATGQRGLDHLIGWVAGPIARFPDVLADSADQRPDSMGLSLSVDVQTSESSGGATLADVSASAGPARSDDPGLPSFDHRFDVMGNTFRFTAWATPGAVDAGPAVQLTLALGVLSSLLAAIAVYVLRRAAEGRRRFLTTLEERGQIEHDLLASVTSAMVVLDQQGQVVMGNRMWSELIDAGDEHDAGYLTSLAPASADVAGELSSQLKRVLVGKEASVEVDVPVDRDHERRWFTVRATRLRGRAGGAVVMHTDITERRRATEDLHRRASRDGLTGLLNRTSLESRADDVLALAGRTGLPIAVLFIDLDNFKAVNDTFGHAAGDGVLRAAAAAIERTVRPGDSVGRLGGDEFVVLLAPGITEREAHAIASRLVFEVSTPKDIDGTEMTVAASVGVAIVPDASEVTRDGLIRMADRAMYRAKQQGGDRFVDAAAGRRGPAVTPGE